MVLLERVKQHLLIIYLVLCPNQKAFLTKTHAAIQHLQRRIDNPGSDSDFICIDSFTRRVNLPDYDIIL